jgi:hypothetical protein
MSRSPASISDALFVRENHSVPLKKLPMRRDGATGISSGCAAARNSLLSPGPSLED